MNQNSNRNNRGMPQPLKAEVEAPVEQIEPKPIPKVSGPIEVMATRAGFYKQNRRAEGDKFTIEGEHHLGTWMKKI